MAAQYKMAPGIDDKKKNMTSQKTSGVFHSLAERLIKLIATSGKLHDNPGVYIIIIKGEIHIFAPPPFLNHIFSPRIFITMRWCAPRAKNFKPFFCSFVNIESIGGKI